MPNPFDRLGTFVASYNDAICKLFESNRRGSLPFHSEPTVGVQILAASDGFLVDYHPFHEKMQEPGVVGYDLSGYDLNTLCQFLSCRLLRVRYPEIGKPYEPPTPVPDTPQDDIIPGGFGIMIHPDVRAALKDHTCASQGYVPPPFPAIQASPLVQYEEGIAKHVLPCRFKIWSPVVDLPGLGLRRLYHWTHADLWWYPDRLNLDPEQSSEVAHADFQALQVIIRAAEVLSPTEAKEDSPSHASKILEGLCRDFEALLDSSGHDEEAIHQWLNEPKHHLFLDSDPAKVWSKVPFGKSVSDFVVRCSDGRYKLIEIEPASSPIFQGKGHEPTARFNHACRQVRDWKQHVREHVHEVRDVQGLADIYEPGGVVIMGRAHDIAADKARKRWYDMKNAPELDLFTYDEVCERVRQLAYRLAKLGAAL